MSTLHITNASAGSGKTFRITREYIKLLFSDPENYKCILAVTFTNKATDEMKQRILSQLNVLATQPTKSPYLDDVNKLTHSNTDLIKNFSTRLLSTILHDYGHFSVSTIDSFFSKVVKSFARELGLQANLTVEVDQNSMLSEVVDYMMDNLEAEPQLRDWLIEFAQDRLMEGKAWNYKQDIMNLGHQLFNEEFNNFGYDFLNQISDKSFIGHLKSDLFEIVRSFENTMFGLAREAIETINNAGLSVDDFHYGNHGVANYYNKTLNKDFEPKTRVIQALNENKWAKAKGKNESVVNQIVDSKLKKITHDMVECFEQEYIEYNTANIVLQNIYTLGLLSDLSKAVLKVSSEKGVVLIANTNQLVKNLTKGNDAPFIYEKTGNRYHHFIIDEFQDTSLVQWHNFNPLVSNSLASGFDSLLVGDIKQSIYRWRNGDWTIMAKLSNSSNNAYKVELSELDTNYRSLQQIVNFNNTIFNHAPTLTQSKINNLTGTEGDTGLITLAYKNHIQKTTQHKSGGWVKVTFVDQSNEKDWKNECLDNLNNILKLLLSNGCSQRSIAILVRDSNEAKLVADCLLKFNISHTEIDPIRFISNESIYLKNSPAIQIIINCLKLVSIPGDKLLTQLIANHYQLFVLKNSSETYLDQPPQKSLPSDFDEFITNLGKSSLEGSPEIISGYLGLYQVKEFQPFIDAFQDHIAGFLNNNPPDITHFLDWWDIKKNKLTLSSPDQQDAIKILTIHKSKGLEFEHVIIPFCNWEIDHKKNPLIWVQPIIPPFSKAPYLPVKYTKSLANSLFAKEYRSEMELAYIDNLNLLYVALTRAVSSLNIIAPVGKEKTELNHVGELLFQSLEKENLVGNNFPITYESGLLKVSEKNNQSEYHDFFVVPELEKNNNYKTIQSFRSNGYFEEEEPSANSKCKGILMHQAFQMMKTREDLEKCCRFLIKNGETSSFNLTHLVNQIGQLLDNEPFKNWYSGNWQVINERDILVPGKGTFRPDRIMLKANEAIVVDFKFGKYLEKKHNLQVENYIEILNQMGYQPVSGYLYYFDLEKLIKINNS